MKRYIWAVIIAVLILLAVDFARWAARMNDCKRLDHGLLYCITVWK